VGAFRVLLGLALLIAGGCRRAPAGPLPGDRVRCSCTYLTDYDDTATVGVEVCVPKGADLDREASQCALGSAHNHIDRCECGRPSGPCDARGPDACTNH
jgi:hypothetical protein